MQSCIKKEVLLVNEKHPNIFWENQIRIKKFRRVRDYYAEIAYNLDPNNPLYQEKHIPLLRLSDDFFNRLNWKIFQKEIWGSFKKDFYFQDIKNNVIKDKSIRLHEINHDSQFKNMFNLYYGVLEENLNLLFSTTALFSAISKYFLNGYTNYIKKMKQLTANKNIWEFEKSDNLFLLHKNKRYKLLEINYAFSHHLFKKIDGVISLEILRFATVYYEGADGNKPPRLTIVLNQA